MYEPHGNHKPIKYTHTEKRKESKHSTKNSNQREESKRRMNKKKELQTHEKNVCKYIPINNYFNVNVLKVPIK